MNLTHRVVTKLLSSLGCFLLPFAHRSISTTIKSLTTQVPILSWALLWLLFALLHSSQAVNDSHYAAFRLCLGDFQGPVLSTSSPMLPSSLHGGQSLHGFLFQLPNFALFAVLISPSFNALPLKTHSSVSSALHYLAVFSSSRTPQNCLCIRILGYPPVFPFSVDQKPQSFFLALLSHLLDQILLFYSCR